MSAEIEFKTGVIKPYECMKEGWELIKPQFWLIFGITFVGILIASFVPFGIALGAMFCGIYIPIFKLMEGEEAKFEDLFQGFSYFVPGLVATLVLIIPAFILTVISYIPLIIFQIRLAQNPNPDPNELFVFFAFVLVDMIVIWLVLGCIHAFLFFAYPLIVEHKLGGWEAFKLSAKAVWKNLSGVVGFITLEIVLGILGYLACMIGVYFTLPVMFAGALVAYRKVFPEAGDSDFAAPSNAY
ncbi:MAG: hypothetical protein HKN25_15095 [Pyrinomonadaceae bacterium]|nr:hypothetical protein [Pyrinomonadaceae bacterium]